MQGTADVLSRRAQDLAASCSDAMAMVVSSYIHYLEAGVPWVHHQDTGPPTREERAGPTADVLRHPVRALDLSRLDHRDMRGLLSFCLRVAASTIERCLVVWSSVRGRYAMNGRYSGCASTTTPLPLGRVRMTIHRVLSPAQK